jgi:hypothetical protein
MSEDLILKCLIAFVLGYLVARMMRRNGLSVGGQNDPKGISREKGLYNEAIMKANNIPTIKIGSDNYIKCEGDKVNRIIRDQHGYYKTCGDYMININDVPIQKYGLCSTYPCSHVCGGIRRVYKNDDYIYQCNQVSGHSVNPVIDGRTHAKLGH